MRTFKRGVFPPDSKTLTNKSPIEKIEPELEEEMVYPIVQHIGAAATPKVKRGDEVKVGQIIADSDAIVSSPVHATVSGTVKQVRDVKTPTGLIVKGIVVENDGEFTEDESMKENSDYKSFSKEDIWRHVRDAGIVGLGGAGFPTHVKLNPPKDATIDTYIINAAECEPYLTLDHRLLLEKTDHLKSGIEIVSMLFPDLKTIIGVETNKEDAIKHLQDAFKDVSNVEIMPLLPKYPQGAEKQLIEACTGRQVPSGGLPADVGVIVNNVDTVVAIDRAVRLGRPLLSRVITVTGSCVNKPGNYEVPLGMSYTKLIEAAGGFKEEPKKLISGGPMMGANLSTLEVPVIKTSSAIVALTQSETEVHDEENCIRCGRCVDHCPINLLPFELNHYAIKNDVDGFKEYNGLDCIECGSCSYICPSKRYLSQSIVKAKYLLTTSDKK